MLWCERTNTDGFQTYRIYIQTKSSKKDFCNGSTWKEDSNATSKTETFRNVSANILQHLKPHINQFEEKKKISNFQTFYYVPHSRKLPLHSAHLLEDVTDYYDLPTVIEHTCLLLMLYLESLQQIHFVLYLIFFFPHGRLPLSIKI